MSATLRGRKHYTSQNVLAAVDFDMRFTYVLAGWEGSAHDASILADSLSRHDGLQIPDVGEILVASTSSFKKAMEDWTDNEVEEEWNNVPKPVDEEQEAILA
ncbi:hypothetical protein QYE76_030182 [Lolium multiflorum]|uniref:DDE Tnp4 domain-containing protein n=1 Tax=Lolium multiflorum TaxID=4521 RepID=A0AAD8QSL9_LOLMU|nr:hypothetical protein QYE76_030182 [Lolium multiflorum]